MRLPTGGLVDRGRPLRYTLDGVGRTGFAGDTLASAMLADGVRTVGPSQYRRRPRGIVTAGIDEPNALAQVDGEPSLTATTVELVDGLSATLLSGVGRLEPRDDAVHDKKTLHDKKYVHTDVLVVGGGPAGLAAALAASAGGARVMLVDDQPSPGGGLLADPVVLPWVSSSVAAPALARAGTAGGTGGRGARTAAGVRRQRPAGDHVGGGRADVCQPVRGAAGPRRSRAEHERRRVRDGLRSRGRGCAGGGARHPGRAARRSGGHGRVAGHRGACRPVGTARSGLGSGDRCVHRGRPAAV